MQFVREPLNGFLKNSHSSISYRSRSKFYCDDYSTNSKELEVVVVVSWWAMQQQHGMAWWKDAILISIRVESNSSAGIY